MKKILLAAAFAASGCIVASPAAIAQAKQVVQMGAVIEICYL